MVAYVISLKDDPKPEIPVTANFVILSKIPDMIMQTSSPHNLRTARIIFNYLFFRVVRSFAMGVYAMVFERFIWIACDNLIRIHQSYSFIHFKS